MALASLRTVFILRIFLVATSFGFERVISGWIGHWVLVFSLEYPLSLLGCIECSI